MTEQGSFALTVQELLTPDAALVLAHVASWRNDDRWFSTRDVADLYLALRIPEPANLSRTLGRLRDVQGLLRDRGGGPNLKWAVTPRGERHAEETVSEFNPSQIQVELEAVPGAFFASIEHPTLPPTLAPRFWSSGIKSFLDLYPFERNVFLMTRFPGEAPNDPMKPLIKQLRKATAKHGLTLHLASDQQIVDDLWGNVGAHMWASRYGIGILETRDETLEDEAEMTLNDNVLIELGSMLTIGRRCMILKDPSAPTPPTDLTSQIYKEVDLEDLEAVEEGCSLWVTRDLRLDGPKTMST